MEFSLNNSDFRRKFKQLDLNPATKVKILTHINPGLESSAQHQQQSWEKLKKHFSFLVSIANEENLHVIQERFLKFNVVRAKGLFCSAVLEAQLFNMKNTELFTLLVSFINLYFPNVAELFLTRCVWQLKAGYFQNCMAVYASSAIFIAHLIYRGITDASLGISVLKLLLRYPTDEDLIRTSIAFYKICGDEMNKNCTKIRGYSILSTVHHMSLNFEFTYKATIVLDHSVLKPTIFNNRNVSTSTDKNQMVHKLNFDSIDDPLDYFDDFEVDIDFIANNKLYHLQVQQLKSQIDYGRVNDSDDADDEEDEAVMN